MVSAGLAAFHTPGGVAAFPSLPLPAPHCPPTSSLLPLTHPLLPSCSPLLPPAPCCPHTSSPPPVSPCLLLTSSPPPHLLLPPAPGLCRPARSAGWRRKDLPTQSSRLLSSGSSRACRVESGGEQLRAVPCVLWVREVGGPAYPVHSIRWEACCRECPARFPHLVGVDGPQPMDRVARVWVTYRSPHLYPPGPSCHRVWGPSFPSRPLLWPGGLCRGQPPCLMVQAPHLTLEAVKGLALSLSCCTAPRQLCPHEPMLSGPGSVTTQSSRPLPRTPGVGHPPQQNH